MPPQPPGPAHDQTRSNHNSIPNRHTNAGPVSRRSRPTHAESGLDHQATELDDQTAHSWWPTHHYADGHHHKPVAEPSSRRWPVSPRSRNPPPRTESGLLALATNLSNQAGPSPEAAPSSQRQPGIAARSSHLRRIRIRRRGNQTRRPSRLIPRGRHVSARTSSQRRETQPVGLHRVGPVSQGHAPHPITCRLRDRTPQRGRVTRGECMTASTAPALVLHRCHTAHDYTIPRTAMPARATPRYCRIRPIATFLRLKTPVSDKSTRKMQREAGSPSRTIHAGRRSPRTCRNSGVRERHNGSVQKGR